MVKWVKPTGDMTPARPEMAARFGNAAQAMKRAVVWLGEKLVLVRIQRSHQLAPELTVTTAAMASTVAGARTSSESAFQGGAGATGGRGRLLGTC